jgi:hypothetical protein
MASFPLVSATGMLGSGFRPDSLDKTISLGARMIGCDAGSTDHRVHAATKLPFPRRPPHSFSRSPVRRMYANTEIAADRDKLGRRSAGNGEHADLAPLRAPRRGRTKHDWLISITAMIVLFWSRATSDLLKSFGWGIAALRGADNFTAAAPRCWVSGTEHGREPVRI